MSEPVVSSRRTLLAGTLTASAFGGLLAGTGSGAAQAIPSDPTSLFFLAIPEIPGDSTDDKHPDTIELLDWSYGVDNTISPTNTGSGTSKSKPRDFVFVSRMGVASPKLFAATAKGTHFASAQLFARRAATEGTFDYLVVKFENLFVTSYAVAPSDTDAWPMDVVHMDYGRITVTFRPRPVAPGPRSPPASTSSSTRRSDRAPDSQPQKMQVGSFSISSRMRWIGWCGSTRS